MSTKLRLRALELATKSNKVSDAASLVAEAIHLYAFIMGDQVKADHDSLELNSLEERMQDHVIAEEAFRQVVAASEVKEAPVSEEKPSIENLTSAQKAALYNELADACDKLKIFIDSYNPMTSGVSLEMPIGLLPSLFEPHILECPPFNNLTKLTKADDALVWAMKYRKYALASNEFAPLLHRREFETKSTTNKTVVSPEVALLECEMLASKCGLILTVVDPHPGLYGLSEADIFALSIHLKIIDRMYQDACENVPSEDFYVRINKQVELINSSFTCVKLEAKDTGD